MPRLAILAFLTLGACTPSAEPAKPVTPEDLVETAVSEYDYAYTHQATVGELCDLARRARDTARAEKDDFNYTVFQSKVLLHCDSRIR